jgi:chromosome segregation ATPase
MEQKIKFIIIGLAGILIISFFINLQTYGAKQAAERLSLQLKNEKEALAQNIEALKMDNQQFSEKISALNADLEKISQEKLDIQNEKDEIKRQYATVSQERDELVEKIKEQKVSAPPKEVSAPTQDAYWAQILKSKTELSVQLDNIRSELKQLKIDNEQLNRDLNNITQEKQTLEKQLVYNQTVSDNIASELVLERNMRRQYQDNSTVFKNENTILRREVNNLSGRKANLEKKLIQLQEEKTQLENSFNEMALLLGDRLANTGDLKIQLDKARSPYTASPKEEVTAGATREQGREFVELPPIVIHPKSETSTSSIAGASRRGSILEINKENNFVIIDLGEDAGVKIGDVFRVYRGGQAIATIEVVQARNVISACDIKKETLPLMVGDKIK